MVLRYSAGIRDLAKTNEHLIEQLIVGRKHKKVQGRLLEKDKVLSLVLMKQLLTLAEHMKLPCRNWSS